MSIDSMTETKTICELELMSVNRVANLLRVNKNEIETAMDLFRQSGGRDGANCNNSNLNLKGENND